MHVLRLYLGCATCGADTQVLTQRMHGGHFLCGDCESKQVASTQFPSGTPSVSPEEMAKIEDKWRRELLPFQMEEHPERYYAETSEYVVTLASAKRHLVKVDAEIAEMRNYDVSAMETVMPRARELSRAKVALEGVVSFLAGRP